MWLQAKDGDRKRGTVVIPRFMAAAVVSTVISALIAAIPLRLVGRGASHLLFMVVAGLLGLLLGRFEPGRLNVGLVFVFFLFEPMGRVLLHQEAVPPHLFLALVLALAASYFFGYGYKSRSASNGTDR
jgi:hypothetical protein